MRVGERAAAPSPELSVVVETGVPVVGLLGGPGCECSGSRDDQNPTQTLRKRVSQERFLIGDVLLDEFPHQSLEMSQAMNAMRIATAAVMETVVFFVI